MSIVRRRVRYVALSDFHIGSVNCRAKALLKILQSYPEDVRFIIVGDLCDRGSHKRMPNDQAELFRYLRENNDRIEAYVDGNHDPVEDRFASMYIGVNPVGKHRWQVSGRKFCAMHGHQFDRFWLIFGEKAYNIMYWVFQKFQEIGWAERFHKYIALGAAQKAARYARRRRDDVIICGHTHLPMNKNFRFRKNRKVKYLNCGCWVSDLCSLVEIYSDGSTRLRRICAAQAAL